MISKISGKHANLQSYETTNYKTKMQKLLSNVAIFLRPYLQNMLDAPICATHALVCVLLPRGFYVESGR